MALLMFIVNVGIVNVDIYIELIHIKMGGIVNVVNVHC